MAGRFECPGCHASLAYSGALAGRTVRCHYCEHAFEAAPPVPRALCPPPLPKRNAPQAAELPVATLITESDEAEESLATNDEQSVEERHRRRSRLNSALFGLLAIYLSAFLILSSGVTYIVWSETTRPPSKPVDPVAPPIEAPVDYERPKSLREVLNESAKTKARKTACRRRPADRYGPSSNRAGHRDHER
jgi:hypothetical protein